MKTEQIRWVETRGWEPEPPDSLGESTQLLLWFSSTTILKQPRFLNEVKNSYPKAHLLGCFTAGEIHDIHVTDDSRVITAVHFEHTQFILNLNCIIRQ